METFSVTNIDRFAEIIRKNSAESLSNNYPDLNEFITIGQIAKFIEEKNYDIDDYGNIILNEYLLDDLLDEISYWIYQVGLSKLCGADKLDCAWDDDENKMVFWAKE